MKTSKNQTKKVHSLTKVDKRCSFCNLEFNPACTEQANCLNVSMEAEKKEKMFEEMRSVSDYLLRNAKEKSGKANQGVAIVVADMQGLESIISFIKHGSHADKVIIIDSAQTTVETLARKKVEQLKLQPKLLEKPLPKFRNPHINQNGKYTKRKR